MIEKLLVNLVACKLVRNLLPNQDDHQTKKEKK